MQEFFIKCYQAVIISYPEKEKSEILNLLFMQDLFQFSLSNPYCLFCLVIETGSHSVLSDDGSNLLKLTQVWICNANHVREKSVLIISPPVVITYHLVMYWGLRYGWMTWNISERTGHAYVITTTKPDGDSC